MKGRRSQEGSTITYHQAGKLLFVGLCYLLWVTVSEVWFAKKPFALQHPSPSKSNPIMWVLRGIIYLFI